MLNRFYIFLIAVIVQLQLCNINVNAAKLIKINGQVLNSKSYQGVPFAAITVQSTGKGIVASDMGLYEMEVPTDTSTIVTTCVGFKVTVLHLSPSISKGTVFIKLDEDVKVMEEVTVLGEKERIVRVTDNISSIKISPILISQPSQPIL